MTMQDDGLTRDWLTVPPQTLLPAVRRAAEIALLAAEEELQGLPRGLTVRYMVPHAKDLAEIYTGVLGGTPPAVFKNVGRTGGTFFPDRAGEVSVHVGQHPVDVARTTLHEATHAWRHRVGARGMSDAEQEAEAWQIAERLLPAVLELCAEEEGR
jgi:hypothetical protein